MKTFFAFLTFLVWFTISAVAQETVKINPATGAFTNSHGSAIGTGSGLVTPAGAQALTNKTYNGLTIPTSTGTLTIGSYSETAASSGTILNTNGNGAALTGLTWSQIGTTPTSLSGYGITDAYTKTASDARYDAIGAAAAVTPTTLGLVIGTNVQAQSATLTTLAGANPFSAGTNISFSGTWPAITINASAGGSFALDSSVTAVGFSYTSGTLYLTNVDSAGGLLSFAGIGSVTEAWSANLDAWATSAPDASVLTAAAIPVNTASGLVSLSPDRGLNLPGVVTSTGLFADDRGTAGVAILTFNIYYNGGPALINVSGSSSQADIGTNYLGLGGNVVALARGIDFQDSSANSFESLFNGSGGNVALAQDAYSMLPAGSLIISGGSGSPTTPGTASGTPVNTVTPAGWIPVTDPNLGAGWIPFYQ